MNPTKGNGQRYIYCPHDGGACLDMVVLKGWSAFNCEKCPIYMQSESYGKIDNKEFVGANNHSPVDEHVESVIEGTGTVPLLAGTKETKVMAKCLVEKCEKEGKHRGLCSAHIQQYRKGTLLGVEPLPSNRGKSPKKERIKLLKESAERVSKKAKGSRLKAEGENQKTEVGSRKSEASSRKVEVIPAVTEEVTTDMVFSLSSNVEDMEKQNRADVKVFARAFMAGLKNEVIAAMTEQIASSDKAGC